MSHNIDDDKNLLIDAINFYESYIMPYKYIYICDNNLKIEFNITPEEVCHLIFGTLGQNIKKKSDYKGLKGFNNIKSKSLKFKELPYDLQKKPKPRIKALMALPQLLDNPKIIYFNQQIINVGISKIFKSDIDANFLIYNEIENINVHLFLRNIIRKGNFEKISCVSLFHNKPKTYIENQIELRVLEISKIPILKDLSKEVI